MGFLLCFALLCFLCFGGDGTFLFGHNPHLRLSSGWHQLLLLQPGFTNISNSSIHISVKDKEARLSRVMLSRHYSEGGVVCSWLRCKQKQQPPTKTPTSLTFLHEQPPLSSACPWHSMARNHDTSHHIGRRVRVRGQPFDPHPLVQQFFFFFSVVCLLFPFLFYFFSPFLCCATAVPFLLLPFVFVVVVLFVVGRLGCGCAREREGGSNHQASEHAETWRPAAFARAVAAETNNSITQLSALVPLARSAAVFPWFFPFTPFPFFCSSSCLSSFSFLSFSLLQPLPQTTGPPLLFSFLASLLCAQVLLENSPFCFCVLFFCLLACLLPLAGSGLGWPARAIVLATLRISTSTLISQQTHIHSHPHPLTSTHTQKKK